MVMSKEEYQKEVIKILKGKLKNMEEFDDFDKEDPHPIYSALKEKVELIESEVVIKS